MHRYTQPSNRIPPPHLPHPSTPLRALPPHSPTSPPPPLIHSSTHPLIHSPTPHPPCLPPKPK
ncbi:hypothetical protein E1H13_14285 [Nodosilinea sp. P-1105]|nr:hypothetical protein [Nodosilinea sp. P-1105]